MLVRSRVQGSYDGSAAIQSFCVRAVKHATANMAKALGEAWAAEQPKTAPSTGESVADLVKAIQKEEVKVHIDLTSRARVCATSASRLNGSGPHFARSLLQAITFKDLENACLPSPVETDKLASTMAKVKKVCCHYTSSSICPCAPVCW